MFPIRRGPASRLERACASPEQTLSRIKDRSNSAIAPKIWNRSRPCGVVVSTFSCKLTNWIPERVEFAKSVHELFQRSREAIEAVDD